MNRLIVACVQLTATTDKAHNVATATRLVESAAAAGARLVALPELFNCLGEPEEIVEQAEPVPGPTSEAMSQLAGRLGITLLAGSLAERHQADRRVSNTSLLFGPDGLLLATYRKLHLFDIDLPDQVSFQESSFVAPGDEIVVTDTPAGRIGQATCYDLRFPELFRALVDRDATLIVIPSAFTQATGRDHWQVLLRARAIENQAFVIAPNQYGRHAPGIQTYGRSMIIDPWGTVLATAPDGEGTITAELDFDRLEQVRARLPALAHRRNLADLSKSVPR